MPDRGMRRVLRVCDFGSTILQYGEGLQLQRLVGDRIRATGASDVLLQLQVRLLLAIACCCTAS